MNRAETWIEVNALRTAQERKHPGRTPASPEISDAEKLVILVEEVGEVARALTYDNGDPKLLKAELLDVATVAVAWLESLK